MTVDQTCPCVHCLSPIGARLRIDKRQRPYIRCLACGATSFLPTGASLRGLIQLAPQLVQAAQRAGQVGHAEDLGTMTQHALRAVQAATGGR